MLRPDTGVDSGWDLRLAAPARRGRAAKLVCLLSHIGAGCLLALLFFRGGSDAWNIRQRAIYRWWHGRLCDILDISVRVSGRPGREPVLLVSNHVSWLDIPVLAGVQPVGFLAKREVRDWPVVGWLCRRVRTRFIARGSRKSSANALGGLVDDLKTGRSMAVFPEGTTHEGSELGNYHPLVFQSCIDAGVKVQPVVLFYADHRGRHLPEAAFIGDDGFVPHLWRMLSLSGTRVYVHFAPVITPEGETRRDLARESRRIAAERLGGFLGGD
ncbi:MAG: 1-acyl-sn-glycerol-3-phosphate acyltransferase [Chromatiales bacterium]|nr:1-acyl-sn-glycerol-3-phosphate acyltransferase [Chromatiales bacterium]